MKIYAVGDIHAEFEKLNNFINKKHPDLILQCGDFGYWPKQDGKFELGKRKQTWDGRYINKQKWYQCSIKNKNTKILFCDGNHEDHESLKALTNNEICPNVFYMPRATTSTLPDGRKILFIGGAESGDIESRKLGFDWFREEKITRNDIDRITAQNIDIVISHTCPREFLNELPSPSLEKINDQSVDYLSEILYKYKPSLWYFGHFHLCKKGTYKNTKWVALNMATNSGWFEKVP